MQYKIFGFPPEPSSHFLPLMKVCDPWHPDATHLFSFSFSLALQPLVSSFLGIHPSRPTVHTWLIFLHLMLTCPVLLGSMFIIPLLTLPQQGEDIQVEKLLIPLFPLLRLGKAVLLSIVLGCLSSGLTACVLLLLSLMLLPEFDFPTWGSWGLNLRWRPMY